MGAVFHAIGGALRDLRQPRLLALALLPPLAAILVWIGLAWAFADDWARLVADWIANTTWLAWVRDWGLSPALIWGSGLAAVALLLPLMLTSAYLNQRMFRYDALAEHASAAEFAHILRTSRGDLFLLGALLSLLLYVPLINLLAPVFSGLAFTHFCLARLARVRAAK